MKLFGIFEGIEGEKFITNTTIVDRTQLEAITNHVHINDIFPEFDDSVDKSLELALRIMDSWAKTLKKLFPHKKSHLVISHDSFGSIIRFYALRDDEIPWIDIENLENYQEEAILIKEI